MRIKVKFGPEGSHFNPDTVYHVYGGHLVGTELSKQAFLFDDECEAYNLSEIEYEVYKDES